MAKQNLILLAANISMVINAGSNWSSPSKQSSNQEMNGVSTGSTLNSITHDEFAQRINAMQEEFAKKDKKFYMIENWSESDDSFFLSKEFYKIGDETFEPKCLLKNMPISLSYLNFCIKSKKLVFFIGIPQDVFDINYVMNSFGRKKYILDSSNILSDREKYAFNIRTINDGVCNKNTNETIILKDIIKPKHMIDFTINAEGTMIFSIEKHNKQQNLIIRKKINDEWITQQPIPLRNNPYKKVGYFDDLKAVALFIDCDVTEVKSLHKLEEDGTF